VIGNSVVAPRTTGATSAWLVFGNG
jgi:hypothetical protein